MKKYDHDIGKADAKYRFVVSIMDNFLQINRKKRSVIEEMLENSDPPYPKYTTKVDDPNEKSGYQYLLGMQMGSVTEEMLEKLSKELEIATTARDKLQAQTAIDVWEEDLEELMNEYEIELADWYERNDMTIVKPKKKLSAIKKPKTTTIKIVAKVKSNN